MAEREKEGTVTTWFIPPDAEKVHRWLTEAELQEMLAEAYKRGAEAMREAAASAVFDRHTTGLLSPAAVTAAVRVIRALPIPEDKS